MGAESKMTSQTIFGKIVFISYPVTLLSPVNIFICVLAKMSVSTLAKVIKDMP